MGSGGLRTAGTLRGRSGALRPRVACLRRCRRVLQSCHAAPQSTDLPALPLAALVAWAIGVFIPNLTFIVYTAGRAWRLCGA